MRRPQKRKPPLPIFPFSPTAPNQVSAIVSAVSAMAAAAAAGAQSLLELGRALSAASTAASSVFNNNAPMTVLSMNGFNHLPVGYSVLIDKHPIFLLYSDVGYWVQVFQRMGPNTVAEPLSKQVPVMEGADLDLVVTQRFFDVDMTSFGDTYQRTMRSYSFHIELLVDGVSVLGVPGKGMSVTW